MDLDLDKIRKAVESEQSLLEWVKKYGNASWHAAMAVIGEPPDLERDPRKNKQTEPLPSGTT